MKRVSAIACVLAGLAGPAHAATGPATHGTIEPGKPTSQACSKSVLRASRLKVEILVTCSGVSVLFAYSPVERLFCDPRFSCNPHFGRLVRNWFANEVARFK